jgi:methylmalonyl-CoA/ethylmalonyl-CoA epimerase
MVEHELGDTIERFDHVSIAVRDIRSAAPLATLMGGTFFDGGLNHVGDFRWVQWVLPGGKLEMIEPVDPGDAHNFLVRFLEERGEGVHHVTFKVTDIEKAVDRARVLGFDVIGLDLSYEFWKEAFVHPKGAHGVLVQLAEWTDEPPPPGHTLDAALAQGR